MTTPLVMTVERCWAGGLSEAIRVVAWSPGGRLLAVGADATSMVDGPANVTTALCGDPVAAAWVDDHRLAVADGIGAVTFAGGGVVATFPVPGLRAMAVSKGTIVVAGGSTLTVFERTAMPATGRRLEPELGAIRVVAPLSTTLWAVAAADGLALVDTALGLVDTHIELAGLVSLAVDEAATVITAGDVSGSLHLFPVGREDEAQELVGYPDAVRLIGFTAGTRQLVAVADDELTWWPVGPTMRAGEEPVAAIAHEAAIVALACGPELVASGDVSGEIRLWSPSRPEAPVAAETVGAEVTALTWSPSGDLLVVGTVSGEIVALAPRAASVT